jgi:hypothetical protein
MTKANKDTRPRVAVYGIVRRQRDSVAQGLAVSFCFDNGWQPVEYVDKAFPRDGQPSEWARLMDDIAKGQLYGVVVRWEVEGLFDYCEQYNTKLCILDRPFDLLPCFSGGRKVRMI